MGSRGGGGLQGLLEHAAREYEKVDTEERGPEDEPTAAAVALLKRSNRPPAGSPSVSTDPEEPSADRVTSSRGDGLSPRDAGTPSRKRQRVDSGPLGLSPSPSRGLNSHFSEDGGASAGESCGGEAEAAAAAEGRGSLQRRSDASVELCQYEGCSKAARSGGRKFCRRHGEGRRCKAAGCNKVDVGGGSCRKHGGGRRCGAGACMKTDVGGGFCVSHGGGKRCQSEGCAKGAQAGGVFCKSHGGGRRCRIEGCMTSAQSGADVLCIKHGGGKRCTVAGCKKLVRKNNRCTKHASEASSSTAAAPSSSSSPPPGPAPATAMNVAKTKAAVAATAAVLTATTTTAAPVAPAPAPRRRLAPPSRPRIAEPGPPSPPEQVEARVLRDGGGGGGGGLLEQLEAQGRGDGGGGGGGDGGGGGGGLLPSVSSMAREPSPSFGPGAGGGPLGGLSSLRPPVAAFDDRVVSAAAPMHGGGRWVPDGIPGHSNGNGLSSRGNDARLRAPLPGISSLGSSLLSVDLRGGTREGPMSGGQLAPHSSCAPSLLLSGAGLPRRLLPGGNTAAARESGRTDIANSNNLPARPLLEVVGPSSARGLPVVDRLLPYGGGGGGGRFSEGGAIERSPSLSPLPPSLLLQQPPPFPPSYLPAAAAASASSWGTSGGKRVFAWSGDADTGSRPAAPCDERGGVPPNGSSSYSWAAGDEPASTAEISKRSSLSG